MNFPRADKNSQWYQDNYPGAPLHLSPQTMVVTLHTTEGATWPSYDGGAMAPNYTGLPPIGLRKGKFRAHFPDDRSSRALVNLAGGVETNTLNDVQIELVGTCDPRHAKSWPGVGTAGKDYVYWPNATKRQLRFVARILAYFNVQYGFQLIAPKEFKAYPSSYGPNNGVRMSFDEWRRSVGVVGHQHIPENVHGDPGNIDINYVLAEAQKRAVRLKKRR